MKRGVLAVAAATLAFGMLAGLAAARRTSSTAMTARLTVVKPAAAKMPGASGRFAGSLLRYGDGRSKLTWTLTYRSLGARVTEAQILVPASKSRGAVSILLCRHCKPSSHGVVTPILRQSTSALLTRRGYVVVSAKSYPRGAIRGRIVRTG